MAFLTESKLARYTERLWANIIDKIDTNKTPIDKTLTQENQSADAKIVGDALTSKQDAGDYALRRDIENLAPVATSGDYNDLNNLPTVYEDVVRYNSIQGLGASSKEVARKNIDVYSTSEVDGKIANIFPLNSIPMIDQVTGAKYSICIRDGILTIIDPLALLDVDYEYTANEDGTYTITSWNGTNNGEASTEIIIPDSNKIRV